MAIMRAVLLRASKSRWLAERFMRRPFARRAVKRFMPGEELSAALEAARRLLAAGIGTVHDPARRERDRRSPRPSVCISTTSTCSRHPARGAARAVSVKLTQLGLDVDRGACERALHSLAGRAAESGSTLWIDMEDSSYVGSSRWICTGRCEARIQPNVGVCLQAYLQRTPADLESLWPLEPAIRLVKGAYAEPPEWRTRQGDVDPAYFSLAERLLEARGARGRRGRCSARTTWPCSAAIRARAAELRVTAAHAASSTCCTASGTGDQRALAADGEAVRVLISYGSAVVPVVHAAAGRAARERLVCGAKCVRPWTGVARAGERQCSGWSRLRPLRPAPRRRDSPVTLSTVANVSGIASTAIRMPIPSAGRPIARKSGVSMMNAPRGTPGAANARNTAANATVASCCACSGTP